MKAMGETHTHGTQAGFGQSEGQLSRFEDADVAARAFKVFVAEAEVELFARGGGDGDGEPPSGLRDASEFARGPHVVVYVLHDFGADHAIEGGIAIGKVEGIALVHRADRAEFASPFMQAAESRSKRRKVEVESYDAGSTLKASEAVPTFAASGVEHEVLDADIKSIEIDG